MDNVINNLMKMYLSLVLLLDSLQKNAGDKFASSPALKSHRSYLVDFSPNISTSFTCTSVIYFLFPSLSL